MKPGRNTILEKFAADRARKARLVNVPALDVLHDVVFVLADVVAQLAVPFGVKLCDALLYHRVNHCAP